MITLNSGGHITIFYAFIMQDVSGFTMIYNKIVY